MGSEPGLGVRCCETWCECTAGPRGGGLRHRVGRALLPPVWVCALVVWSVES